MRRMLVRAVAAAALLAVGGGPARAAESLGDRRDTWQGEITKRPLTLGAGMIEVWAPLQLDVSKGAGGKPVTSNPSLALGVTDTWMVGIRHLEGLCLGGASNGCANLYNDTGLFTRVSLLRGGGLDVAIQGGVDVTRWSAPRSWAGSAGLLLRAGGGAFAVTAEPNVSFGLRNRDTTPSRTGAFGWNVGSYDISTREPLLGNRESLSVPVTLQLQLAPALAVLVGASLEGPLDPRIGSFSDFYRVPAGAALVVTPLRWIDVGASLTFPMFAGRGDTRDLRVLALFLAFRS